MAFHTNFNLKSLEEFLIRVRVLLQSKHSMDMTVDSQGVVQQVICNACTQGVEHLSVELTLENITAVEAALQGMVSTHAP